MSYIEKEGIRFGSSKLEELEDTNILNPSDGQATIYDATDGKWENKNIPLPADMVGAAAAASGSHGLVPAPAAGDNEKFLRGDGTWQDIPVETNLIIIPFTFSTGNTSIDFSSSGYLAKDIYNMVNSGKFVVFWNSSSNVFLYHLSDTDGGIKFSQVDLRENLIIIAEYAIDQYGETSRANRSFVKNGSLLPTVTSTDNDKILKVVSGAWTPSNLQTGVSESVVADEYDSTKTYNIADYCMHSSKLYKCNTANTTGAWDSAKWDETCVGDELTLKTAVIVAPRVDQTATYTYNGTEQTLAFEYINSNNTIVTGNKHTDAGTYTCTVSLKNPNDLWSDTMDNVDKTFTWTINKVTSSITLSPTTFYFDNGTPQTLTATVIGQPLVLSGYDTSLITVTQVSAVSGVYTYNIKASGTAGTTTITASIAESTNYTAASATASVETEAFTPGATLVPWSSGTDQEITDMINSYYNGEITLEDVKSVWSIGDVRSVDISAMTATGVGESHRAQTVEMEILDFDHDTLTTPIGNITKALITVDMKNCLRDANVTDTTGSSNTEHGYMNSSNTNQGGWTSCARRTWCNNVFYNALPSYFKSLVKPVDKLTSAGNQSDIINTDSDYCFLLSEIEIFGSVSYSKAGEGSQYAWFANATANRYKLPKWNSSSVSDSWWERSPDGSFSYYFCSVGNLGNADSSSASSARGLAPACCL